MGMNFMDNKEITFEDKLMVQESLLHGKGIFTTVDIPEGEIVMVITGEVIDGNECERREEEEDNFYIFWNGDDNYIDTAKSKVARYLNHLCEPNCYVDEKNELSLYLISDRFISAGEEITIDYDYEEIYENCTCNLCQKKVSNF